MSYFYISNPYNGTEEQKESRAKVAAIACGDLLRKGIYAWSPIVHNHAMLTVYNNFTLDERREKILPFDFTLLESSKGMIILEIEGWDISFGVEKEIELCRVKNIPIYSLHPDDIKQPDFNLSDYLNEKL